MQQHLNDKAGSVSGNTNASFRQMPYDLVKELFIALGIIGALVLILAAVFSTPDVPALSAKQVDKQAPSVLVDTALQDLSGQDAISTYGPPYSNTPGAAQTLGPISPQQWAGVQIPINSAQVNVIGPLQKITSVDPSLQTPLSQWKSASKKQQAAWVSAVQKGMKKGRVVDNTVILPAPPNASGASVASTDNAVYGPVPRLLDAYLGLANSGLLESAIDGGNGPVPVTDRTKSLLLLQDQADSQYAQKLNMTGEQWGVIKETGNYPGAVWLWYYTLLYQIPPFSTSDSADLWVVLTVGVVTLILMLTPFIPGLRRIPHGLKIYRLIWRDYYREQRQGRRSR